MCRTARRRACSVPVFAFVMSFSTNGRSSLALASVVSMAPLSMSDDARFRISASFCSLVRRSCRPALRCRIASLLHVVRSGRRGLARRRAPIHHAQPAIGLFEAHPEIEPFTLEQIRDLLERLFAEVLHLQDLAFRLPYQITQG